MTSSFPRQTRRVVAYPQKCRTRRTPRLLHRRPAKPIVHPFSIIGRRGKSVSVEDLTSWSPPISNYGYGKVLRCQYRDKLVVATPEEIVRQRVLRHLVKVAKWPIELIDVEPTQHLASGRRRRPDILLFNERHEPCVIVECKRPEIPSANPFFLKLRSTPTRSGRRKSG